jgi:hypothetical protein
VAARSGGENIDLVNHVTVDTAMTQSLARTLLVDSFRGPRALRWLWVLVVAAAVFVVFPGLHNVTSALIVVVWLIVIPTAGYLSMRRVARGVLPTGSTFSSGFGAAEMKVAGPAGETVFPYDVFTRVDVRGQFVIARTAGKQRLILPLGLFPGDAVERVRAGKPDFSRG